MTADRAGGTRISGCRYRSTAAFAGTAQAFQESLASEPLLIAAALLAVYHRARHAVRELDSSAHDSLHAALGRRGRAAGAAAVTHTDLSVIALIGIILLIGIVKKNAIMMIDFALRRRTRTRARRREDAIFQACLLRFRPIMMTTMAALLGGLPLALGTGAGSELRRPLGIAIVGGLIVSQMLTLYTTPVIYLYLDRAQLRFAALKRRFAGSGVVQPEI